MQGFGDLWHQHNHKAEKTAAKAEKVIAAKAARAAAKTEKVATKAAAKAEKAAAKAAAKTAAKVSVLNTQKRPQKPRQCVRAGGLMLGLT